MVHGHVTRVQADPPSLGCWMQVALDVDGTVIDARGEAYPQAVERAWELAEASHLVGYVTYRSERTEEITRRALAREGLPDEPVYGCPPTGVVDAAGAKAQLLLEHDVTHYVGDAPFDREAARRAGCGFLEAEDWRTGAPLPDPPQRNR